VVSALARKARTFEEIYVVLHHWNLKWGPINHRLNFSESIMAKILYKKIDKMANTSERRKRMSQLRDLNELFGYSY
jgi:hypothetical protein